MTKAQFMDMLLDEDRDYGIPQSEVMEEIEDLFSFYQNGVSISELDRSLEIRIGSILHERGCENRWCTRYATIEY
jgi:hypothetical protein